MLLRTLGGLRLDGAALTRPKPLLVLAHLTLEGAKPRRELAECFFGDAADPRDSLSTALRHLRGVGALDELPDDRLASRVESDATRLLRDFDAYRYQAVLDAYEGPFLAGLEVGLGVEAEEWLFGVREAVADRVRTAALHRARAALAEGRHDDARRLTSRAVRLPGAAELEADEAASALALAEQLDLPEAGHLRALAFGFGLDPGATGAGAVAVAPTFTDASVSLHRSTRFIGRARELEQLVALLGDRSTRLVTLLGMGGIGKTRLVVRLAGRLAARSASRYPDGVAVVSLEAITQDDDALGAIAARLALPVTAAASEDALVAALARWDALLVLDNVEQLEGGARLVAALVQGCPRLQLLATSRRRLALSEERIFELDGLATSRAGASGSDAAKLFLERAVRAGYDEEMAEHDLPTVEALCHDLDGYPLGIELAASWTRLLGIEEIRSLLREGLDILEEGPVDAPPRHRAVRAALEPSWKLLAARERLVLQRLGVFRGSFAFDAASSVAGATLPLLARLVDHALVRSEGGGRGRFAFHPVMHAYVRERTPNAVHLAATQAHTDFYEALLERSAARVGNEPVEVLDRLAADLGDVAQAIRLALDGEDPLRGVAMARSLAVDIDLLQARPTGSEVIDLVAEAAAVAEAQGTLRDAERLWTKLANARRALAGDVPGALRLYQHALSLAERSGDVHARVMLCAIIGAVESDAARAREFLATAHALATAAQDDLLLCEVLQRSGYRATKQGDWDQVLAINTTAVELAERLQRDAHPEAGRVASLLFFSLHNLACAYDALGSIETSLELRQRALDFAGERGQWLWVAYAHHDIAMGLCDLGRWDEAIAHGRSAAEFYRRQGDTTDQEDVENLIELWSQRRDAGAARSR